MPATLPIPRATRDLTLCPGGTSTTWPGSTQVWTSTSSQVNPDGGWILARSGSAAAWSWTPTVTAWPTGDTGWTMCQPARQATAMDLVTTSAGGGPTFTPV